jgi:hypothetical protein
MDCSQAIELAQATWTQLQIFLGNKAGMHFCYMGKDTHLCSQEQTNFNGIYNGIKTAIYAVLSHPEFSGAPFHKLKVVTKCR